MAVTVIGVGAIVGTGAFVVVVKKGDPVLVVKDGELAQDRKKCCSAERVLGECRGEGISWYVVAAGRIDGVSIDSNSSVVGEGESDWLLMTALVRG